MALPPRPRRFQEGLVPRLLGRCRHAKAKVGARRGVAARTYVLDTSLLLGGKDPPRDGTWATTSEAAAEVKPGGRDARRYESWLDLGLQIRGAAAEAAQKVEDTALAAGNLDRLSAADRSLLALALEMNATLLSDDYTMLDVARRLGVASQTVNQQGIEKTMDFRPRCSGCGRWFETMPKGNECTVCGSPVKDKPKPRPAT
jgi:endoribonuclease Nob1